MMLLIVLLMLAYPVPIGCYLVVDENYRLFHHEYILHVLKENLLVKCSQYTNDDAIRKSFPFCVESNPKQLNPSQTYVSTNANKNIYHLNIVNQKFFPPIAFCLQNLEKLYVRNSSFVIFNHKLPSVIQFLGRSLTHLEIYDTKMTYLSNEIGKLTRLKTLKLSNTDLVSLPDEIGDLSSLTFLFLPNNKLTFLPKNLKQLRSVQQIMLTNNPYLRSIEPVNGLPSLRILQTDNCPIGRLPLNLPQLRGLYMSKNNLTNLTGIQTLGDKINEKKSFYFDNNYIQSIPSEIQFVNNLVLLNLNNNTLDNLPLNIFNINTLRNLYIKNNKFSDDVLNEIIKIFNSTNPKLNLAY